ncbi:hypothetical protein P7K49_021613 [Saguinus oedipus]|uniref:Skin secretory protein xP2-like n=1 Tax=Saguinus oedipus TaxID=9490 RepID=A0ABQ9UT59_SAGOE|nr:hypothetical protein P7K49_021613 [Saguinus oedipus]
MQRCPAWAGASGQGMRWAHCTGQKGGAGTRGTASRGLHIPAQPQAADQGPARSWLPRLPRECCPPRRRRRKQEPTSTQACLQGVKPGASQVGPFPSTLHCMRAPAQTPTPAPEDAAPAQTPTPAPEDAAPAQTPTPVPEDAAPAQTPTPAPEDAAPAQTPTPVPEDAAPAQTPTPAPEDAAPAQTPTPVPEDAAPAQTPTPVPEDAAPAFLWSPPVHPAPSRPPCSKHALSKLQVWSHYSMPGHPHGLPAALVCPTGPSAQHSQHPQS